MRSIPAQEMCQEDTLYIYICWWTTMFELANLFLLHAFVRLWRGLHGSIVKSTTVTNYPLCIFCGISSQVITHCVAILISVSMATSLNFLSQEYLEKSSVICGNPVSITTVGVAAKGAVKQSGEGSLKDSTACVSFTKVKERSQVISILQEQHKS